MSEKERERSSKEPPTVEEHEAARQKIEAEETAEAEKQALAEKHGEKS